jgi:hypothetical protein
LSDDELKAWDESVLASSSATLFHTTHWLVPSGAMFVIYGVFEGDTLKGGFVAPYRDETWVGRVSVRPPWTPYGGLVVFPQSARRSSSYTQWKTVASTAAEALVRDFNAINVRLGVDAQDVQSFSASVRYTYQVDITCMNRAWSAMDQNHKRSVRSLQKQGYSTEVGASAKDYLRLFRATRGQENKWCLTITSYESTLRPLGLCETVVLRDALGEPAAAVFVVFDRERAYYLLGGCRPDLGASATALALWEAMNCASKVNGVKTFDLEGSMIPGVELFFRKFGGVLTPFYTVSRYSRRARAKRLWSRAAARFSMDRAKSKEDRNV